MPATTGPLPYNIDHLLGGACRILVGSDSAPPTIPVKLEDIITNTTPYAPKTGWVDFGATKEGASYTRDISSEGYEIQQATGNVLEEITEVERTLQISIAEFRKEHFRIMEESSAAAVSVIAETASTSPADMVKFGGFSDLTHRRMAAIGLRSKASGIVKETATVSRGRFLALVFYDVALAADSTEVPWEKGSLAEMPITFKSFPVGGQTAGQEHGFWLDEGISDYTVP